MNAPNVTSTKTTEVPFWSPERKRDAAIIQADRKTRLLALALEGLWLRMLEEGEEDYRFTEAGELRGLAEEAAHILKPWHDKRFEEFARAEQVERA